MISLAMTWGVRPEKTSVRKERSEPKNVWEPLPYGFEIRRQRVTRSNVYMVGSN